MPTPSTKPKASATFHAGQHTFLVNRPKKTFQFVDHTERNKVRVQRQIRINAGRHVVRQKITQEDAHERQSSAEAQEESWMDEAVSDVSPVASPKKARWAALAVDESNQIGRRKGHLDHAHEQTKTAQIPESRNHVQEPQSNDLATYFSNVFNFVGSAVNPFDTMPTQCNPIDKFLLHQYFSVLPEQLYGIRKDAPFNPQRDLIFPQSYRHPAIFQWVLVSVSSFYTKCGGKLDPAYTARARSKAYRLINEGLSDPAQHKSDELLGAITSAVMVESRYGDPSVTGVHLEGLRNFLDKRGGIESLVGKNWYPVVVQACHLCGSGLGAITSARDIAELRKQTDTLVKTLLSMQRFDLSYQRLQLEVKQGELEQRLFSTAPEQPAPTIALFKKYAETRKSAFSPGSPLFTILSKMYLKYRYLPYVLQHCLLAVLLSLNLAILDYSKDLVGGINFLNKLVERLQTNGLFVNGSIVANIETLNLFLVTGGLDGEEGVWCHREFTRKWMVIDAMRVIKRLSPATRDTVQEVLYGYMVEGDDVMGPRLDELVLENIKREALDGLGDDG